MKGVFILFALLICIGMAGQEKDILEIREYYNKINGKITDCKNSKDQYFECKLFCDKLQTNHFHIAWPGLGNYDRTVTFWYYNMSEEVEEDECADGLVKVEIQEMISIHDINYELLFMCGDLIFCFQKEVSEAGVYEERYYFKDGKLIRYLNKEDGKNIPVNDLSAIDYDLITELGEYTQQLFSLLHDK